MIGVCVLILILLVFVKRDEIKFYFVIMVKSKIEWYFSLGIGRYINCCVKVVIFSGKSSL